MATVWLLEGYDDPYCAPSTLGAYSTLDSLREHAPGGEWTEDTDSNGYPSQYTITVEQKFGKRRYEVREVELDKAPLQ